MTPLEFWKKYGGKKMREVCGLAGTTIGYFEHIAHGRKHPSSDLALAIAEASAQVTGERIDPQAMLAPKKDTSKREALRRQRAEEFARSQRDEACAGAE
ncbi:hypothetical protein ABLT15_26850 [Paraburkholderia tropica]|uniref:hypothetical protein n=1 Tax=Paraburkholderia tropica TaxID=92647 RepID=UPI0032B392F8